MNKFLLAALVLVTVTAFVTADVADAKRLGGGRSFGAQRQATPPPAATVPPKTAPGASTPSQTAPATTAPAAAAKPAAAGASRWLGPIAGLAAGLGLAALLSHFGLGEGFATALLIALMIGGAFLLVRLLVARRTPAAATPDTIVVPGRVERVEPRLSPAPAAAVPAAFEAVLPPAGAAAPPASAGRFPPGFDPAPFVEQAKLQFRRMQAAYDAGDRKALADVMTPEMFGEVSSELAARQSHLPTEVMRLDADVLEAVTEGDRHWMSVRFTGLLREDGTVLPKDFDEIWNLTKPVDGSSGWLLAGIQQTNAVA